MNPNYPHFVTEEMAGRLRNIFDSHPSDLNAVADTISYEYPELGGRQAGLAVLWAKGEFSGTEPAPAPIVCPEDYTDVDAMILDHDIYYFLQGTGRR